MNGKKWYASKTLWTNLVGLAAVALSAMGYSVLDDPATQAQVVAGVLAVVNFALRLVTKEPVTG